MNIEYTKDALYTLVIPTVMVNTPIRKSFEWMARTWIAFGNAEGRTINRTLSQIAHGVIYCGIAKDASDIVNIQKYGNAVFNVFTKPLLEDICISILCVAIKIAQERIGKKATLIGVVGGVGLLALKMSYSQ